MYIEKNTALREGEFQIILMMDSNLYLKSLFRDEDPYIEPKGKLTCQGEQVRISQVFNCVGLLLCILKGDPKVVVWNPYWGQTRWIEPRYFRKGYMNRYIYALGYVNKKNESCRRHKILRFFDDDLPPFKSLWYEIYDFDSDIYDFDSDLWTTLDVPSHWSIMFYQRGVSLKGNTYFCATKMKTGNEEEVDSHLICFDFTKERFGRLLPFPFRVLDGDTVTLSCVRKEKLAVLFSHDEYDIWITTKIEAERVFWSKFLTFNIEPGYLFSPYSGLFIDEEKKVAMGFDVFFHHISIVGEAGCLRQLVLGERVDTYNEHPYLGSYVPSLVQIKQPQTGKRKKHNNLEEYNKKMLRIAELEKSVKEQSARRGKMR